MRKNVVGLLSIVLVVAIVAVVWWRGRALPAKLGVPPKPSEVSVAPAPARTPIVSEPKAKPTEEPAHAVATIAESVPVAAQPLSVTSSPVGPATVSAPAAPTSTQTTPTNEEMATRRMYAAHAPLRAPEVADPDSTSNRQILQTMVQKALVHAKAIDSAKP